METLNVIKFGISDDFTHTFGNDMITNILTLNFNEMLISTTTNIFIIDYKNKIVKTKYQLKFSTCTIIPDINFLIGVSSKKGDLLFYQLNKPDQTTSGDSPPLIKRFKTNQTDIYHILYSQVSQSIITFGSEIKVFNFQYKTIKSKINISITNRSTFANKLEPTSMVLPQFDYLKELILLPTERGIYTFNLDGKKINHCSKNTATTNTIFSSIQSTNNSRNILTYDSDKGMILWGNKGQILQKYDAIRSSVLAILFIDSENSICLNNCHILFYLNIQTGKPFYYMNLNKTPTRLFLIILYNEPILCACFGSTLRALNLTIPWRVWHLNIEKTTSISRCNKYMTAARILIETESSFAKFFSPRDRSEITIQTRENPVHPIYYYYDRGTIEKFSYDQNKHNYNVDVIKITNHLNFVRDTLFVILQNGSILEIETNVKEGQKEVKLKISPILMTTCRIKRNGEDFQWCFAVASENCDLLIIDYFTFDEVCHFSIGEDGLIQMFFDFQTNFIILVFEQKTVLFDIETGKTVDSIEINGNKITSLFGDFLMYGYESGHIQRVKIENNRFLLCNDTKKKRRNISPRKLTKDKNDEVMLKPHSCPITAFSFSPKIWISSGLDGNVVAYNYDFDILCKISLPLPLRSCLIMNGRRDILVATATEIMEIKNDFLLYDVNTTRTKKNCIYLDDKAELKKIEGFENDDDEEEEESVDPEIKEIDNFDRMKDEFFIVKNDSKNIKNSVENENEIVPEVDSVNNKEETKEIRKYRRSKMVNNNKATSISTQSIKSLPHSKNNKNQNNNNDEEDDKLKKNSQDKNEKENSDKNSNKDLDSKSSKDTIDNQNKDSESSIKSKDETQNDESNSTDKSQLNNQEKSNSAIDSIDNQSKVANNENYDENHDNCSTNLNDSNNENLFLESDENATKNSDADSSSDQLNGNSANDESSKSDGNSIESNELNSSTQQSDESSQLDGNDETMLGDKDLDDGNQNDRKSEGCENNESQSAENEKLNDVGDGDESQANNQNENAENDLNSGKEGDEDLTNAINDNDSNENERSENDRSSENLLNDEEQQQQEEDSKDNNETEENDDNSSSLNKQEQEDALNETEANLNLNDDDANSSKSNENSTTSNENDATKTNTSNENSTTSNENETNSHTSNENESNSNSTSTTENEADSTSTTENESFTTSPDGDDDTNDNFEQHDQDENASFLDDQQSLLQSNIQDELHPSLQPDEDSGAINDENFNSDDFVDTKITRSPTPPPIRPALTTSPDGTQFDSDSSTHHNRRSRTPSPRRSHNKGPQNFFGAPRIPANIVIDREAVLALYGRGRVEFLPFVEQIQREFLINHYGDENGASHHITLSYVNNLTKAIRKKEKGGNRQKDNRYNRKPSSSLSNVDNSEVMCQNVNGVSEKKEDLNEVPNIGSKSGDWTPSPHRVPKLPKVNLNKSFSPTAYVYNYDNNTETFFNKLEINNGVTTPRRMHAYSVRRPLIMIQPQGAVIVRPNVQPKRNKSFRNQRNSPVYQSESPRRKFGLSDNDNDLSDKNNC